MRLYDEKRTYFVLEKDFRKRPSNHDIPRIHNLSRLYELCGLKLNNEIEDLLDLISTFNISTRYPDYKQEFYKKCDKTFTQESINKIREVKEWIIKLLEAK